MKLITLRSQILTVSERWDRQYRYTENQEKLIISKKLKKLDLTSATKEDITHIIGNDSWVRLITCDECQNSYDCVVLMGEEPDYESNTAYICISCVKKALELFEKV